MAAPSTVPEATVLRLSRYHCLLGQLLGEAHDERIRSRELASELGLSEETVRRDLSYVNNEGRPGAGYEIQGLYEALQEFLDLSALHPFVAVGNADVLRGLTVTFPAGSFGMRAVGYFSERAEDEGASVGDLRVRPLGEAAAAVPKLGATVALVACAPEAVPDVLSALRVAGITGVLMLTPMLRPHHPEGMNVTFFRIPCGLKALVSAEAPACGCSAG